MNEAKGNIILTIFDSFSLSGCLSNDDSGDCAMELLTFYDILALSDEMVDAFTEETGYCVNFIKADDSGGT